MTEDLTLDYFAKVNDIYFEILTDQINLLSAKTPGLSNMSMSLNMLLGNYNNYLSSVLSSKKRWT